MKKISIIVPVYNVEQYLKKCLDSLVNQTLDSIEIIVINDGSLDNSKEIIKRYQKKYNDKIVFIDNKNQGIGKTRNEGIKKARGEYLAFVDSDDYVDINMYKNYYEFAKENNLDIVTGDYIKVKKKEILFKTLYFNISNINKNPELLIKLDYGPCNKIFKRDIVLNNNILFEENLKYEDMPFLAKALYNANKIGHINKSYYHYCIRSKSETTTVNKRNIEFFDIINIINNYYKDSFKEEIEGLNAIKITDYMIWQRYQKDKVLQKEFINKGYEFLNNNFNNWKKNKYYKKINLLKRIVMNNKFILNVYCKVYRVIY